jgi:predicted translin family RNA/ssDNA-binding protein
VLDLPKKLIIQVNGSLKEVNESSRFAIHHYLQGGHSHARELLISCRTHTKSLVNDLNVGPLYLRKQGYVTEAVGSYVEAECFECFFLNGTLASPSECIEGLEDEEYLCGVLSYCQSLSRYAVERAYHADVRSLHICKDIISSVMEKLIQFDFRNGLIRRKFDSLKYSLKSVEDLL